MKTYRDLVNYANTLEKKELTFRENQLERIFNLGWDTLSSVESTPLLSEAEVVSDYSDNRAYEVNVIYFKSLPFVVYSMGGRSYSDHETIRVINKDIWIEAKKYVLSLIDDSSDVIMTDLDAYIEREYAGNYPWQYLGAKPEMYKASSQVFIDGKEEFVMDEQFYTAETALERLQGHQEFFVERIKQTAPDVVVTFGESFVEQI